MKINYKIVCIALLVLSIFILIYFFYKPFFSNNFIIKQGVNLDKKTVVSNKTNADNSNLQDIYVHYDNGHDVFYGSYTDVYMDHYHWSEYHDGSIYLIRRIGTVGTGLVDDRNWQDELWKFDSSGKGKKIYALQGLDFRVSPDEKYIIISNDNRSLIIFNQITHEETKFVDSAFNIYNELNSYGAIVFENWSDNSQDFWLRTTNVDNSRIFRINLSQMQIFDYFINASFEGDYALNPNNGLLAYSDYPRFYDLIDYDKWLVDQKVVILKVLNLFTSQEKVITQSKAQEFNPKWLDNYTIKYDVDSKNDGKAQFRLSDDFLKPKNDLSTKFENWDLYKEITDPEEKWVGSGDCSDESSAFPNEFGKYRNLIKNGSIKELLLPGNLSLFITPNYFSWSNEDFLGFNGDSSAICAVAGRYPLRAYPDKLLWGDSCGSGAMPIFTDEIYNNLIKCEESGKMVEEYFKFR